ncbi:hypothetical protein V5799_015048 [Amblyomma americanum]|uniref:Uncharacterized protein n=1 Tax=Amblyomma americanum TaxID=6943 RepID=A0AAQ4E197_AMBAM
MLPRSSAVLKITVHLCLQRGTAPAPLDVPQSEAGTSGPRVGRQKAVPAKSGLKGINLDWNRPGDTCVGHGNSLQRSQSLIDFLSSVKQYKIMFTVPPLPEFIEAYNLSIVLPKLQYVVVATHKLRRPGVVACTGERALAAVAFRKIRDQSVKSRDDIETLRKFAYSISVRRSTCTPRM